MSLPMERRPPERCWWRARAGGGHVGRAMGRRPLEPGGMQEAGKPHIVVVVVERRWSGVYLSRIGEVLEQGHRVRASSCRTPNGAAAST